MYAVPTALEKAAGFKQQAALQVSRERAAREAAAVMERAVRWATANPDVMAWLDANMGTEFGRSLAEGLNQYGSLTERQVGAIRAKIEAAKTGGPAPEISVARIEEAFSAAKENGIKRPKMRLDTFKFAPAPVNGSNAGAIYVTEDGAYLGKVVGGKFLKVRDCTDEQQARIVAAASDPAAAATAYGQRTGTCAVCGRELTAEDSIERTIGPVCAEKYGWA